MPASLAAAIVNEGAWLPLSLGLAALLVTSWLYRWRGAEIDMRRRVLVAMTLAFAATIAVMAFGHLLAVTTKLAMGTLRGAPLGPYAIGVALAAPSWWLLAHAPRAVATNADRRTVILTSWAALTLLALGPHNLPLAAPGLLNIAYVLTTKRAVGWALVGVAATVHLGLLIGSLVFLASGQTFEQFSAVE